MGETKVRGWGQVTHAWSQQGLGVTDCRQDRSFWWQGRNWWVRTGGGAGRFFRGEMVVICTRVEVMEEKGW